MKYKISTLLRQIQQIQQITTKIKIFAAGAGRFLKKAPAPDYFYRYLHMIQNEIQYKAIRNTNDYGFITKHKKGFHFVKNRFFLKILGGRRIKKNP